LRRRHLGSEQSRCARVGGEGLGECHGSRTLKRDYTCGGLRGKGTNRSKPLDKISQVQVLLLMSVRKARRFPGF
jgi:hypothetical protein